MYPMELNVLDKSKNSMKVEVVGETHTLVNLLRENAFVCGADQASYIIEHPYMSQPKLIVKAGQPKKVIADAAEKIAEDAAKFKKAFEAEFK